jgi:hypothetical protein
MSQVECKSASVMTTPTPSPPNPPSLKIISGGQTGADRAGLDVAIARGLPHGGWRPKGQKAGNGPLPGRFRLTETRNTSYLIRAEHNVAESDATVIFTLGILSGGSQRLVDYAGRHRRPYLHLQLAEGSEQQAAQSLASFVRLRRVARLNVAGSSEIKEPGVHALAGKVLGLALDLLGFPLPRPKPEAGSEPPTATPSDFPVADDAFPIKTPYMTLELFNELHPHRMHRFFVALNDPAVSDGAKQFLRDCGPILMSDASICNVLPFGHFLVSFYRQHGFSVCVSWCDGLVSIRVEKGGKSAQATVGIRCEFEDAFHNLGEDFDDLLVTTVQSIGNLPS